MKTGRDLERGATPAGFLSFVCLSVCLSLSLWCCGVLKPLRKLCTIEVDYGQALMINASPTGASDWWPAAGLARLLCGSCTHAAVWSACPSTSWHSRAASLHGCAQSLSFAGLAEAGSAAAALILAAAVQEL